MLFVDRNEETIADGHFFQLPDFLNHGDVLVINDSKVIPARLFGKKQTGGIVEILLLVKKENKKDSQTWEVLVKPAKRLHKNDIIIMGKNCEAKIITRISDKKWLLEFSALDGFENYLNHFGRAPCHLISSAKKMMRKIPEIWNDIKQFTQKIPVPLPLRLLAFIFRQMFCNRLKQKVCKSHP